MWGGPRDKADAIEVGLFEAILKSRVEAANAGASAAARDLRAVEFRDPAVSLPLHAAGSPIATATTADITMAERAARGYGKAIRAELRDGATIREAVQEKRWVLDKIAATENAQAFNEARREEVRRATSGEVALLMRTWDATLDSRVCADCEGLDGTSIPFDGAYPGGLDPGDVHPNCRCIETISTVH